MLFAVSSVFAARADAQQGIRVHMHAQAGYASDGQLYLPVGQTSTAAAILLIPDEKGLITRVVDTATGLAEAGYVVLAVDLNRGLPAENAIRSNEQVQHDVDAALAYLSSQRNVRPGMVGAVAWGSGAEIALKLATDSRVGPVAISDFEPVTDYYPLLMADHSPVLAFFFGHKRSVPVRSLEDTAAHRRPFSDRVEVKVYAAAQRGFDDPDDPSFRPDYSVDMLHRQIAFFFNHLSKDLARAADH